MPSRREPSLESRMFETLKLKKSKNNHPESPTQSGVSDVKNDDARHFITVPSTTKPSFVSRFRAGFGIFEKLKFKRKSKKDHPELPEKSGASKVDNNDTGQQTQTSQPWENLEFYRQIICEVTEWKVKNPGRKFATQFKDALARHDYVFEVVPDGPIPIRGLVKSVVHIVQLGVEIKEAQGAALDFVESVLGWVEQLVHILEEENGVLMRKARDNLLKIWVIIDKLCTWANKMLNNPTLKERYSVMSKITSFKTEFDDELIRLGPLNELLIIASQATIIAGQETIAAGQDNIVAGQAAIVAGQDNILGQIAKNDGVNKVKKTSTYQDQEKVPCYPSTRENLLTEIMDWVFDMTDPSSSFLWLTGDPGVGKSTITASIAEGCLEEDILWAQFFINRNDASTTDPPVYFLSIFQQISNRISSTLGAAASTNLPQWKSLNDISKEATKAFLALFQQVSDSCPNDPIVIVIDALDESQSLKETAEIFANILVELPKNIKVFISSRVEDAIRRKFDPLSTNFHVSTDLSTNDVALFLGAKMSEIMEEQEIDKSLWGQQRMDELCRRASGLFIWAVTAIKYIRAQIEESGTECFSTILGELNTDGTGDIDALYLTILEKYLRTDNNSKPPGDWSYQRFRRVVGAIIVRRAPLTIGDLTILLKMRKPGTDIPVDIQHVIRRLRVVLVDGVEQIDANTIPRVHESFTDFITGPKADKFRVLLHEAHGEFALQCFRQFRLLSPTIEIYNGFRPVNYAIAYLLPHLDAMCRSAARDQRIVKFQYEELCDDPLDDLELRLIRDEPIHRKCLFRFLNSPHHPGEIVTYPDGSYTGFGNIGIHGLKFAFFGLPPRGEDLSHWYERDESGHHSRVVWPFRRDIGYLNFRRGGEPETFDTFVDMNHGKTVKWSDLTISVWDDAQYCFIRCESRVNFAAVSEDATLIVSAHDDGTVHIWDVDEIEEGEELQALNVTSSRVLCAFFSTTGQHVLVCSSTYDVTVWDWETGEQFVECPHLLGFTRPGCSSHIAIPNAITDVQRSTFYSYRIGTSSYLAWPPGGPGLYYDKDQEIFVILGFNKDYTDIASYPATLKEPPINTSTYMATA